MVGRTRSCFLLAALMNNRIKTDLVHQLITIVWCVSAWGSADTRWVTSISSHSVRCWLVVYCCLSRRLHTRRDKRKVWSLLDFIVGGTVYILGTWYTYKAKDTTDRQTDSDSFTAVSTLAKQKLVKKKLFRSLIWLWNVQKYVKYALKIIDQSLKGVFFHPKTHKM